MSPWRRRIFRSTIVVMILLTGVAIATWFRGFGYRDGNNGIMFDCGCFVVDRLTYRDTSYDRSSGSVHQRHISIRSGDHGLTSWPGRYQYTGSLIGSDYSFFCMPHTLHISPWPFTDSVDISEWTLILPLWLPISGLGLPHDLWTPRKGWNIHPGGPHESGSDAT